MPRNRKIDEVQVNVDLDKELNERLDTYCDREGVKKKYLINLAILRLLNQKERGLER